MIANERTRRIMRKKCHHPYREYLLSDGAGHIQWNCTSCGHTIERLGWDDLPPAAREAILVTINGGDYEE